MKLRLLALLIVATCVTVPTYGGRTKTNPYLNLPGLRHAALATESDRRLTDEDAEYDEETEGKAPFLRVTTPMKDMKAISGEKVQFKCKVEGWPNRNITYTWYKDDLLLDPMYDHRVAIATRSWGSRLRMADLYTLDSGRYRCEASNGWRRVETTAMLYVSFQRPPPLKEHEKPIIKFPSGKCEKYDGFVCADYLKGMDIFVDSFQTQIEMNEQIKTALSRISNPAQFSPRCQRFLIPAFCHFVFPQCKADDEGATTRGVRLCREDCQLLKSDICRNEYLQKDNDIFIEQLFNTADCSELPSSKDGECARIGIPDPIDHKQCFHGNGDDYRGTISVTASGKSCQVWPKKMAKEHSELLGGHNFCRNPDESSQPWCFTDVAQMEKESCEIKKCTEGSEMNFIFIAVPCGGAVFLLICLCILCCACRRRSRRQLEEAPLNEKCKVSLLRKTSYIPRLQASSLRLLTELGVWESGKSFNGEIVGDPNFEDGFPVLVKMLQDNPSTSQLEAFKREIEVLSDLQHPNIACLKAVIIQPNCRCLLFENAEQIDLQQHLAERSGPASAPSDRWQNPNFSLLDMATQVAWGMEYLASRGFVHKDLAARSVSVSGDATVKISLVGIVPNAYRSSYYQTPERSAAFPIRWMSPESLQAWTFTVKSDVYSFGVVLWEMYSNAAQPYGGNNDPEVLKMITGGKLLPCPDHCPAKVYSLMRECWSAQPSQRPSWKEISEKLDTWKLEKPPMPPTQQLLCSDLRNVPSPPPDYSTLTINSQCSRIPSGGYSMSESSHPALARLTSRDDELETLVRFQQSAPETLPDQSESGCQGNTAT